MLNGRTYINRKVNKLESSGNTGFLEVRVFSEEGNPIEGARVSVSLYELRGIYRESAIENEIVSHYTDENGKIPIIELPVIHELGEANTDEYHMRVDAPGFYSVIVMNIEIFPNTTTSFNVVLTPVMEGESYVRFIIIPEKHW
ncbi:MAG TPA: carboxypeptidase-like regulatory domain-containing protein [Sedimentibacter sp.]|nr:carboxypeptidase-like regulatory domain-containing protein [Sedimentibacter sp.]HQO71974.1 carboxypeptidase-like regulatory domain-containing protein [Sedimentibacter sp.]